MNTIIAPKRLIQQNGVVSVSRMQYAEFLAWQNIFAKKVSVSKNDKDTDLALKVYNREKKSGKLTTIKSLADLD